MAIIKLIEVLVDILYKNYSDYKAYVTCDKRVFKQLLLCCQNTLYGAMVVILIYYCKFTKSITSIGFDINPYDPYIFNKVVDWSHMIILFHVDECKLS